MAGQISARFDNQIVHSSHTAPDQSRATVNSSTDNNNFFACTSNFLSNIFTDSGHEHCQNNTSQTSHTYNTCRISSNVPEYYFTHNSSSFQNNSSQLLANINTEPHCLHSLSFPDSLAAEHYMNRTNLS